MTQITESEGFATAAPANGVRWIFEQSAIRLCPPSTLLPFRAAHLPWFVASLVLNCLSAPGLWAYIGEKKKAWIGFYWIAVVESAEGRGRYRRAGLPSQYQHCEVLQ
jgi:hypothetical protein